MREPLPTKYDPNEFESTLYAEWEERGWFHANAQAVLEARTSPYVIVIPPPNVTAVLHMGHGLNNTIQDVLTRWQRMKGREALYLPGTDHAGIATQNVVERQLAQEGRTRDDLGREAFVERVWSFVDATGSTILQQLRAIGCSCDWERTRFTLEPALSRAVREVFVRLYENGLIYRGHRIINWCPRCLTALSDEEAEAEETNGRIYHLRYPLAGDAATADLPRTADGRPYLVVATTRPETMLGDTAVAVHPDDERYSALVGATVDLPLTGRQIPIVADSYVDPEFGSGAVKITPAHDPNDFELARRHDIDTIDVMTPDAHMNEQVPEPFRGLDRFEARKRVVAAFEQAGLLEKIEDHRHALPHCYRCGTIVEPRLSDQWFVKMQPLAEPALRASREKRVSFTPERYRKIYDHWLENIRDWCISRQLWWGHRIPVWYCQSDGCSEIVVAREDPAACPKCGGALEQDPDVLDTWFSSWLWPFSTLGWPDDTPDLKAFYPTQTLVTAPEILFFWVARMIMSGYQFMGDAPFTDVYLTGTVRDMQGRKMSKSLGNGIDPLEVVRLFGADALRYTVVSAAGPGTDVQLDPNNLEESFAPGRNFANKLWNAARFALMNLQGDEVAPLDEVRPSLELADRWILSRLSLATHEVTRQLEAFRFDEAAEAARAFFWGELADWYLELIKPRMLADADPASRAAAESTLVTALDTVLRLLHPIMPFVTETLWRKLPARRGLDAEPGLMVARWPERMPEWESPEAEAHMNALMELIGLVRALRAEYKVPEAARVRIRLGHVESALASALAVEERALQRLARVREIELTDGRENGQASAHGGAHAVLRGGTELFMPLEGIIDLARERSRLNTEIERLDQQVRGAEAKLANQNFVARAPENVVAYEREKLASLREQRERLNGKLQALS